METQRFGYFTVIGRDQQKRGYFLCRCDCGAEKSVRGDHLRAGKTQSCGCLHKKLSRERALAGVPRKNFDGHSKMPEYAVWLGMLQRCNNPNNPAYKYYGGRGIAVCEHWLTFQHFIADMGPRPEGGTIDRRDNDGPYSPDNCSWRTRLEQQNNRRINHLLEFDGQTMTVSEWARKLGIARNTLFERIDSGWSVADALTTKVGSAMDLSGLRLGGNANSERQKSKTHCKNGHEFTEANTLLKQFEDGRVWRSCRTCHNERQWLRTHARKAK